MEKKETPTCPGHGWSTKNSRERVTWRQLREPSRQSRRWLLIILKIIWCFRRTKIMGRNSMKSRAPVCSQQRQNNQLPELNAPWQVLVEFIVPVPTKYLGFPEEGSHPPGTYQNHLGNIYLLNIRSTLFITLTKFSLHFYILIDWYSVFFQGEFKAAYKDI